MEDDSMSRADNPDGSLYGDPLGSLEPDDFSVASEIRADRRNASSSSAAPAPAWNSLSHEVARPIWETGFWKHIFGTEPYGDTLQQQFRRPSAPPPVLASVGETVEAQKKQRILERYDLDMPLSRSCVKRVEDVTWQESREALLQKALKHWAVIVEGWNPEVAFVHTLLGCDSINAQLIFLSDVFRNKAPSTLMKRANSIKRLCSYLGELGLYFPCSESMLYTFICDLRSHGFPPSRAKGVLEAIAFVKGTMGIDECAPLLQGRRCWGAASQDVIHERSQASPLLVKELQCLRSILEHGTDLWDRAFSGMVLFVTYARARSTDAQQASPLLFDTDESGSAVFVEASTGVHKTVRALQHRRQFLPLVAPGLGLSHVNWANIWKDVRRQLGLKVGTNCPIFPAPMEDGTPGKRFLTSQERGKWLRALIQRQMDIAEDRKVSSHSLKCTTLSMLAKRGVSVEDRLILGYHTSPFRIGLTYSRDAMSRPLMILEKLLEEVREGKFQPDVTRSGRFSSAAGSLEKVGSFFQTKIEITSDDESGWRLVEEPDKDASTENRTQVESQVLPLDVPLEDPIDLIDVCADSSASSGESDGHEGFAEAGKRVFQPPVAPEGFHMWQHSKSKILHLMNDRHSIILNCGRKVGQFHTREGIVPRWDSGICWRCFKGH